jgi:serine/threonine-protein kinase
MSPQQLIGHYRVIAKLGEGGMGAVYRATDTKLNRDVAVKIVPDAFASDSDRLARFTREAQVLASLNHPNIAAIYGVEERALVLELVEGNEPKGPLTAEEAVPIVHQLADALEYAHERGIVHRDLKPANLKLTPEGNLKVLDFGLAKALSTDPASTSTSSVNSPTLTMRATMAGMIMGTAAYMAPEQARGQQVDKRADIWAFGAVVYELLTGTQLFQGDTVSDILASVLKNDPDLSAVPPRFHKLLRLCLTRDPRQRLRDISGARLLLEEAPAPPPVAPAERTGAPWWMVAAVGIVAAALTAALMWQVTRPAAAPMVRFRADLGPESLPGLNLSLAISRDGNRVAFPLGKRGKWQLATRLMDQSSATVLAGTDYAETPFFSPDGQWIAYAAGGKLNKVSVQGGAPVVLCDATLLRGGWWGDDGYIYASLEGTRLSRVPDVAGKAPEKLSEAGKSGYDAFRWPQLLPGGDSVLVTSTHTIGDFEAADLLVYSLKSQQLKVVQRGAYSGYYLPSGHLVYLHLGTLFAVPFDPRTAETRGSPVPVVQEVMSDPGTGGGQFSFSANGTLAYLAGKFPQSNISMKIMDRSGKQSPFWDPPGALIFTPRFSPDGKELAAGVNGDIVVYSSYQGTSRRLTFDAAAGNRFPVWTSDGKHILYTTLTGIWWVRSDGSGKPEKLLEGAVLTGAPLSPDGKILAITKQGEGRDLYTVPLDFTDREHPKAGTPAPFVVTEGTDWEPAFSPDGRWMTYTSNQSGTFHVFVRPFPEGAQGGGQAQISAGYGRFSKWSPTAKEIYYLDQSGHIMVVPYTINGRAFAPGKPVALNETLIGQTTLFDPYDVAPDGKHFAVFPLLESEFSSKTNLHITFLLNFFDELKRKVR